MPWRPSLALVMILPILAAESALAAEVLDGLPMATAARQFAALTPVSDAFRQRLGEAATTIPAGVWRRLDRAGWKIRAAGSVVEALPTLKGQQPRGWPEGTTWENTDAVHLVGGKLLVMGEQVRNRRGEMVPGRRVDRVLRHEVGHAYDAARGGEWRFTSSQPAFLAAYQRDLSTMAATDRPLLEYYLQSRAAGRQEAFAEAFAEVCGGGSSPERAEAFRRAFPRVLALVEKLIAEER